MPGRPSLGLDEAGLASRRSSACVPSCAGRVCVPPPPAHARRRKRPAAGRQQLACFYSSPEIAPRRTLVAKVRLQAGNPVAENRKGSLGCLFGDANERDQAAADLDLPPVLAYLCLNLSTRPAVSTIFCLPV